MLEMPNTTVSKSYIPHQGVFVSASKASKYTLRRAAKQQRYGSRTGKEPQNVREAQQQVKDGARRTIDAQQRALIESFGKPLITRKINGRTIHYYERPGGGGETIMRGGKRGTSHVRVGADASRRDKAMTTRHEMAHATPRRTQDRYTQMNARQRGAEEGRADAVSGSDYRRPGTNGSNAFYYRSARSRLTPIDPGMRMTSPAHFQASGRQWGAGYRNAQDKTFRAKEGERPRRGKTWEMTPEGQTAYAIGAGATGAVAFSNWDERRRKQGVRKSMPDSMGLHVPGSSFSRPKPKAKLKRTAGM